MKFIVASVLLLMSACKQQRVVGCRDTDIGLIMKVRRGVRTYYIPTDTCLKRGTVIDILELNSIYKKR